MNSKTALRRLVAAIDNGSASMNVMAEADEARELLGKLAMYPSAKRKPASVNGAAPAERPVVICTDKRGVFFGYATDTTGDPIVLAKPRMCVYWDMATKGILGLAATGPTKGCRITNAPPKIELRGITAVIECSAEAVVAWEKSPWSA